MSDLDRRIPASILVCTYRRPAMLMVLLDSLARQEGAIAPSVFVIDNDPAQSARSAVLARQGEFPWPLVYLHEPEQNISLARNRGLDYATGDFIAFIDDDEVAEPKWLHSLIVTATREHAQLVFGPVLPVYPAGMPQWLIDGKFYERPRHATGAAVPLFEARTGNVLIDRAVLGQSELRFDPALGLSGGEDYVFFRTLFARGSEAVWCDEALVQEEVPLNRATAPWLIRRSFRVGSVEATLGRREGVLASARIAGKVAYLFARSVPALLLAPVRSRAGALAARRRLAIGLGLLYGLVYGPYREYK